MNRENIEYGIKNYGTPMYVFDTDIVTATTEEYRNAVEGRAGLCYAMKTNPFIVRHMASLADRIEVCSMGEFQICRDLKIPVEKILISGVLKKPEDICEILDYYEGRCLCSIESESQLSHISDWSRANEKEVRVFLRLSSGNQFGMDKKTVFAIIENRERYPWLKIMGIHYFSGTLKKKSKKLREEISLLDEFMVKIEQELKFSPEELEYGPGLAVPYFKGQQNTAVSDLKELTDSVSAMRWKGKVMLEMGRAFAASCGYYFTRVRDVKTTEGINYCIVDGGIHQLHYDGQIRGMYHPDISIFPERDSEDETEDWNICGSLCTANDVLVQKIPLQRLNVDDVLVFENAGAYSAMEGMALFLSHELPRAALYSRENGWKIIREEKQIYKWNMEKEN